MSIMRTGGSATLLKVRAQRLLAGALAVGGSIVLAQCGIVKPEMPSFTTWLNIPFEQQDIRMADVVEDEDILAESEAGLCLFVEGDSVHVALDQDLTLSLDEQDSAFELGDFDLDTGDPDRYTYEMVELYPAAGDLPPGLVAVPPFEFVLEPEAEDVEGVESAHVASGFLRAIVLNEMQVPVSGPELPQTVRCEIRDTESGALLDILEFPDEIAPMASDTAYVDLAGAQIPDSISARILGGSPGHPGVQDLDPHRMFNVIVDYVALKVDHAVARIGEQSVSEVRAADLGDSLRVIDASIGSGSIDIALDNEMPLPVHAKLVFHELWRPGGGAVGRAIELAARESGIMHIDLAGVNVIAPEQQPLDSLHYTVDFSSPGSGGKTIELAAGDFLASSMAGTQIALSRCTGLFPEKTIELERVSQDLDMPAELAGVHFSRAALVIQVLNRAEIPAILELEISSHYANGDSLGLVHSASIEAAGSGDLRATQIVLDESNSILPELLSGAPTRIEMKGRVQIGGDQILTAEPGQSADILWNIEAPLKVRVDPTEIRRDPFKLDVEEGTLEDLQKRLRSARLWADIENTLPLSLEMRFLVGGDSATVHTNPLREVGPFSVAAAPTDAAGIVTEPIKSIQELTLDRDDVLAFTDSNNYVAVVVNLPGTGGSEITLISSNAVTVRGILKAELSSTDD